MSDLDRFFNECAEVETKEVTVGDYRFRVRRIDGVEALELAGMEGQSERVIFVLGRCLLDDKTGEGVGVEKAEMLLRRAEPVALELVSSIYEWTSDVMEGLETRWGLAKKKSPVMSSGDLNGNTAEGMG